MPSIQIKIPVADKKNVKNTLKTKFPEFDLLIFEETIYKNSNLPNDPSFNDINKSWYDRVIGLPDAWNLSQGNRDLVVAIIDDGFDLTHKEFEGKIYKPFNATTRNSIVNTGQNLYHGTHVAGLAIANANNYFGISGAAPNCKLMPIQVGDYFGRMSTMSISIGIQYAINNGANVVNLSLGQKFPKFLKYLPVELQKQYIHSSQEDIDVEKVWNRIFNYAYAKNVTIILAAGNDDVLIELDPMHRSDKTIIVSASDFNNGKASFSNYGYNSTISAPGVSIFSSIPRQNFDFLDGTSMAAPIVTGCIALLKSVNPSLSFNQLVDLIQSTGKPIFAGYKNVGNLIQIRQAMNIASQNRKKTPVSICSDVQRKIDSLTQEIDKLRKICINNQNQTKDTLKIPPKPSNFNFAQGRWKSSSRLYNTKSGVSVTLFFDINQNGSGKISLFQSDNTVCEADMNLQLKSNNTILIRQQNDFSCQPDLFRFKPYSFVCSADNNGTATCEAQNNLISNNHFTFNLIKIK